MTLRLKTAPPTDPNTNIDYKDTWPSMYPGNTQGKVLVIGTGSGEERETEDGEKAERRRKSLLSAETQRHAGTKWAGYWGFQEALPTQHICCRRAKWVNALDSEIGS